MESEDAKCGIGEVREAGARATAGTDGNGVAKVAERCFLRREGKFAGSAKTNFDRGKE